MQSTPDIHPFTHHSQSPTVNSSQYATTTTNTKDTHNVSTKTTTVEPEHTRVPLNKPTENPSINVGLNTLRVNTKKNKKDNNKKDKKSKKEKKTKRSEKDDSRLTVTNSEAANIRYERDIIVKRAGICERRASANPTPGNKELSKFMKNICDEFKKKFG
jgi:lipopolysaccharide assembly outer membrane protein LptD (OstA)